MATSTNEIYAGVIDDLRAKVDGRIVTPDDEDYDSMRIVADGAVDAHPAAIVRVAHADDVAAAVQAVRDRGLDLAVRSGGHGAGGLGTVDGGLVLDLRDLIDLDLDLDGRTAWVGAGWTAGALTTALGEHRLAIGFGDTGSVGVGGITLGGGVGYLGRKLGLTIDSLLGAEVVTADGQVHLVDATDEPDLFWAIRGGGGNMGVVTRFRYRLNPVASVVGGMLVLPATPETVAGFVAAADAAPDDLSTIANVMPCPPLPFVPEERHGEIVIFSIMVHAGETSAGERAVAPFRALAEPLADLIKEMPYPDIYQPEDESYRPMAAARTLFVDHVGLADATAILAALAASDSPMRVAQLRVLGGAIARVPVDATAYAHRASRIMVNVAAFYEGDEDRPRHQAWVDGLADQIRQEDHGEYVNFVGDEGEAGVRAAYPGTTWDRLAAIKRRYDPTNLFRRNQNVPPA